jgi:hypothetical protein
VEEVAKTEASIVRHALLLRRLVLRYFKALLMFIWTVIVTVAVAAVLRQVEPNQVLTSQRIFLVSVLYMLWTLTTPFVVKRPIDWIYALGDPDKKQKNQKVTKDPDLQHFENVVIWFCYGSSGLGLLYAALVHYRIIQFPG